MSKVQSYEALVPYNTFLKVRDALAGFVGHVRQTQTTLVPATVALEAILQAESVHQDAVYTQLQQMRFDQAIYHAQHFFDNGIVNHVNGNGQRDQSRMEFDAIRRWGVSSSHAGDEVFWLAMFSMLYSAPFDNDFYSVYAHVANKLDERYDMRFHVGSKEHEAIGRQFNQFSHHVKFFAS
jgi:hypothetical protein